MKRIKVIGIALVAAILIGTCSYFIAEKKDGSNPSSNTNETENNENNNVDNPNESGNNGENNSSGTDSNGSNGSSNNGNQVNDNNSSENGGSSNNGSNNNGSSNGDITSNEENKNNDPDAPSLGEFEENTKGDSYNKPEEKPNYSASELKLIEERKTLLNAKLIEYGKLIYETDDWLKGGIEPGVYYLSLRDMAFRNGYDISMFYNPVTKNPCNLDETKIEFIVKEKTVGKTIYEYNTVIKCQF